jgi:hypothetical protein
LFDLLDDAARKHNITESEVVHAWKSNRWVVNILKQLPIWQYTYTWQSHCNTKYQSLNVFTVGDTAIAQLLSLILVLPFIGCSYFIIWDSVMYWQSVLSLQSLQFLEVLLSKCILQMYRVFVRNKAAAEQELNHGLCLFQIYCQVL